MVYQQIVGIPMSTKCAPLIADLFLYCYERDFISNLQKSKRFDLIDKFNNTSRYLDDIFTIDNPAFAELIPDIYPRKLQLNKANTSDTTTSLFDLNIKVTVNVVIFAGGKFRENVDKTFHVGVIFTISLIFSS